MVGRIAGGIARTSGQMAGDIEIAIDIDGEEFSVREDPSGAQASREKGNQQEEHQKSTVGRSMRMHGDEARNATVALEN